MGCGNRKEVAGYHWKHPCVYTFRRRAGVRQVRHSGAKFKRHKKLSNQKKNKVNEIFLRAELMQKIHDKQNIKIIN